MGKIQTEYAYITCNVKTRVLSKLYLSVKNDLMYLQSLESNPSAIIKAIKAECRAQGKEEEEMDRCQRGAAAVANPFVKLAPPCHVSRMQHTSYMLRRQFQWCGDVSNWMQILYILVGTYWWKNCTLFVERKSWGMRMRVAAVHGDYLYIDKLSVLVLEFRWPTDERDTRVTASTVPSVTYLATDLCS